MRLAASHGLPPFAATLAARAAGPAAPARLRGVLQAAAFKIGTPGWCPERTAHPHRSRPWQQAVSNYAIRRSVARPRRHLVWAASFVRRALGASLLGGSAEAGLRHCAVGTRSERPVAPRAGLHWTPAHRRSRGIAQTLRLRVLCAAPCRLASTALRNARPRPRCAVRKRPAICRALVRVCVLLGGECVSCCTDPWAPAQRTVHRKARPSTAAGLQHEAHGASEGGPRPHD